MKNLFFIGIIFGSLVACSDTTTASDQTVISNTNPVVGSEVKLRTQAKESDEDRAARMEKKYQQLKKERESIDGSQEGIRRALLGY
ncbi:hypothetical protein JYT58_01095 [bacterium AH-315-G11]|nr:hypothetical protein [bacterium AH-315-G11]